MIGRITDTINAVIGHEVDDWSAVITGCVQDSYVEEERDNSSISWSCQSAAVSLYYVQVLLHVLQLLTLQL